MSEPCVGTWRRRFFAARRFRDAKIRGAASRGHRDRLCGREEAGSLSAVIALAVSRYRGVTRTKCSVQKHLGCQRRRAPRRPASPSHLETSRKLCWRLGPATRSGPSLPSRGSVPAIVEVMNTSPRNGDMQRVSVEMGGTPTRMCNPGKHPCPPPGKKRLSRYLLFNFFYQTAGIFQSFSQVLPLVRNTLVW